MKKPILLSCLVLSGIVMYAQGFYGHHPFRHDRMESRAPVTGAPYSALETIQIQRMLANGNRIDRKIEVKVFRDGQGRTRAEHMVTPEPDSGKQPYTRVMIVDPVAGFRYVLNSSDMTAYKMPLRPRTETPGGPGPSPRNPHNAQIATVDLGTQTINGVPATGKQTTETIPAGAIGNEQPIQVVRITWTSTALKVPVQVKTTDPRFGTADRELTNIVPGEPDPSLFAVPSGYTIKTPSFGPGGHEHPGR